VYLQFLKMNDCCIRINHNNIFFSISNNRASVGPHWLRYYHCTRLYFNPLYWKICIALLCSVFADPVTYIILLWLLYQSISIVQLFSYGHILISSCLWLYVYSIGVAPSLKNMLSYSSYTASFPKFHLFFQNFALCF